MRERYPEKKMSLGAFFFSLQPQRHVAQQVGQHVGQHVGLDQQAASVGGLGAAGRQGGVGWVSRRQHARGRCTWRRRPGRSSPCSHRRASSRAYWAWASPGRGERNSSGATTPIHART